MEWLIALAISLPLWLALPFIIARSKRKRRGKKHGGGLGSVLNAGFAVFDPAKARAVQTIEIRKDIGDADEGNQGELFDHKKEGGS